MNCSISAAESSPPSRLRSMKVGTCILLGDGCTANSATPNRFPQLLRILLGWRHRLFGFEELNRFRRRVEMMTGLAFPFHAARLALPLSHFRRTGLRSDTVADHLQQPGLFQRAMTFSTKLLGRHENVRRRLALMRRAVAVVARHVPTRQVSEWAL